MKDEEKGEEAPKFARAVRAGVNNAQEVVGATRLGHGRTKFGPDKSVAEREAGAEDPAEHGLRAAHRGEDQRQRDERADADHVEHVERDRAGQAEAAREGWRGSGGDGDPTSLTCAQAARMTEAPCLSDTVWDKNRSGQ